MNFIERKRFDASPRPIDPTTKPYLRQISREILPDKFTPDIQQYVLLHLTQPHTSEELTLETSLDYLLVHQTRLAVPGWIGYSRYPNPKEFKVQPELAMPSNKPDKAVLEALVPKLVLCQLENQMSLDLIEKVEWDQLYFPLINHLHKVVQDKDWLEGTDKKIDRVSYTRSLIRLMFERAIQTMDGFLYPYREYLSTDSREEGQLPRPIKAGYRFPSISILYDLMNYQVTLNKYATDPNRVQRLTEHQKIDLYHNLVASTQGLFGSQSTWRNQIEVKKGFAQVCWESHCTDYPRNQSESELFESILLKRKTQAIRALVGDI